MTAAARGMRFWFYAPTIVIVRKAIDFLSDAVVWRLKRQTSDSGTVRRINGSVMRLDFSDMGMVRGLIVDGVWEPQSTSFMRGFINSNDVVLDIGSNIGYYVLLEAQIVGQKGLVYAIEPVPENQVQLQRNIQLNKCSNVEAYSFAIGDRKGIARMNVPDKRNWSSISENGQVAVEMTTVDDFLRGKRKTSVVRMDVEGYEYEVIKGMKHTLFQVEKLFIEFHFDVLGKERTVEIMETLRRHGFKIVAAFAELKGVLKYKGLFEILKFLECKRGGMSTAHGRLDLTIDDIVNDPGVLARRWGHLEIFLQKVLDWERVA